MNRSCQNLVKHALSIFLTPKYMFKLTFMFNLKENQMYSNFLPQNFGQHSYFLVIQNFDILNNDLNAKSTGYTYN